MCDNMTDFDYRIFILYLCNFLMYKCYVFGKIRYLKFSKNRYLKNSYTFATQRK